MGEEEHAVVLRALAALPRWHVVHWGAQGTSTLVCLWVGGRETLVPIDGLYATYKGRRRGIADGELGHLLRQIQKEQDEAVLATADALAARDWLKRTWQEGGEDGHLGIWEFPRGGFLRWIHNGTLHVEASEGGRYDQPMPDPLRDVLVDLGWNPPDHQFRNCWVQPSDGDFEQVAQLCVLTPLAAFGCDTPPPWKGPDL